MKRIEVSLSSCDSDSANTMMSSPAAPLPSKAKRAALRSLIAFTVLVLMLGFIVLGTGAAQRARECVETCHADGYACAGQLSCECSCASASSSMAITQHLEKSECTIFKEALIEDYKQRMMCQDNDEHDHGRQFGSRDNDEDGHSYLNHHRDQHPHENGGRKTELSAAKARAQSICVITLASLEKATAQCPAFTPGSSAAARYDGAHVRVPGFNECAVKHESCLKEIPSKCIDRGVLVAATITAGGSMAALLVMVISLTVFCWDRQKPWLARAYALAFADKTLRTTNERLGDEFWAAPEKPSMKPEGNVGGDTLP